MVGEHIFLGEIKADPKPGPFADAIHAANGTGLEYWGIWNILAFHPMASYHLCELSHELMHKEGPISAALREVIAAYTSSLNQCDFCRNAHAAVATHLYSHRDLVEGVLRDPETSALAEKEKALLRFIRRLTLEPGTITQQHIEALTQAGWGEPAIYDAIYACALFNYYNRFVLGNGVRLVSDRVFDRFGARMARVGYSREQPPPGQMGTAHA